MGKNKYSFKAGSRLQQWPVADASGKSIRKKAHVLSTLAPDPYLRSALGPSLYGQES